MVEVADNHCSSNRSNNKRLDRDSETLGNRFSSSNRSNNKRLDLISGNRLIINRKPTFSSIKNSRSLLRAWVAERQSFVGPLHARRLISAGLHDDQHVTVGIRK